MRLVRHDGNNNTVFSAALSVVAVESDGSHMGTIRWVPTWFPR